MVDSNRLSKEIAIVIGFSTIHCVALRAEEACYNTRNYVEFTSIRAFKMKDLLNYNLLHFESKLNIGGVELLCTYVHHILTPLLNFSAEYVKNSLLRTYANL